MEMLVFNGQYDAYFWVLCADKYFKVRGIPEDEKMTFVAMAMNGCALNWWRWWYPHHPEVTWDSFTLSFLWRFKPEDRFILPIVDDEEEPNQELPSLNRNSHESLNDVLLAWDKFLTSTKHIDVPTLQVSNLNVATFTPMSDFNDEVVDLQDSTTKLVETQESLGENHFEDPNRFADLDFKYTLTAPQGYVIHQLRVPNCFDIISSNTKPVALSRTSLRLFSDFDPWPPKPPDQRLRETIVLDPPPPPKPPELSHGGKEKEIVAAVLVWVTYRLLNPQSSSNSSQWKSRAIQWSLTVKLPWVVVILFALPPPEPPDKAGISTSLLVLTYPWDPGPFDSPPLTTVSGTHYFFQLEREGLIGTPSQSVKEIDPQLITMLLENSTRDARVAAHVFNFPIPACPILFPIVSAGVIVRFEISASDSFTNIKSSCDAHGLFVKRPLKTNFFCDTLKSLLCEIQLHASLVQADIETSGTVGLVMFLLNTKLGVLAFDCQFMELRMVWLIIIDIGSTDSDLILLRHLVDEFACELGSRFVQYVFRHFSNAQRFVQNFLGYFVVAGSNQTCGCSSCNPMLLANTLIGMLAFWSILFYRLLLYLEKQKVRNNFQNTYLFKRTEQPHMFGDEQAYYSILLSCKVCSTQLFSPDVLEEAASELTECQTLMNCNSGTLIVLFLGDVYLGAVLKLTCQSEKHIMKANSHTNILLASLHGYVACLNCCCFDPSYTTLILFEYLENGTLEIHLRQGIKPYIHLDWYSRLIFAAETTSIVVFLHYEPSPPIFHHSLKSGCFLTNNDFSIIIARLILLYCVATFYLQLYESYRCLSFSETDVHEMASKVLYGTIYSNHFGLRKIRDGTLEEIVVSVLHGQEQPYFHQLMQSFTTCATRCWLLFSAGKHIMLDVHVTIVEDSNSLVVTSREAHVSIFAFVHSYNSHFKQWDPGGCYVVHWECLLALEAFWKVAQIITQHIVLTSTLRTRLIFNGGGNVMILESNITQLILEGFISCYICCLNN